MKGLLPIGPKISGRHSKKAQHERRTLVFIDETGFMLQPTVRRTWAPRGHTPIHHSWDRHDRLSVTGAIIISPVQKRLGFYFPMSPHNLTGDDLFACVQLLRGHLKRPLLIIWDRFSGHKKAARLGSLTTFMVNRFRSPTSPRMPLISMWSIMPGATQNTARWPTSLLKITVT
jgi:hypothetical protein